MGSKMASHPSSACRELLARLCDYLDGELAADWCAELERHLAVCDDCRVLVDTTRKTVLLFQRYGRTALPAEAEARLWGALRQAGCLSSPMARDISLPPENE